MPLINKETTTPAPPPDMLATETRPCGECFWSCRVETYDGEMLICKKKIMKVTKTMLVTYHKGWGTCFEYPTIKD